MKWKIKMSSVTRNRLYTLSLSSMSFSVTDMNRHISSFLSKGDVVSFLKSSKDLRNDLYNIPYKHFIFDQNAGMSNIKGMMFHLDDIEILEIIGCDFIEQILLPMKNLKSLTLKKCTISDHTVLIKYFGSHGLHMLSTDNLLQSDCIRTLIQKIHPGSIIPVMSLNMDSFTYHFPNSS